MASYVLFCLVDTQDRFLHNFPHLLSSEANKIERQATPLFGADRGMSCPTSVVTLLQQVPTYVIPPWDEKIIPLGVEQTILFQKARFFFLDSL